MFREYGAYAWGGRFGNDRQHRAMPGCAASFSAYAPVSPQHSYQCGSPSNSFGGDPDETAGDTPTISREPTRHTVATYTQHGCFCTRWRYKVQSPTQRRTTRGVGVCPGTLPRPWSRVQGAESRVRTVLSAEEGIGPGAWRLERVEAACSSEHREAPSKAPNRCPP